MNSTLARDPAQKTKGKAAEGWYLRSTSGSFIHVHMCMHTRTLMYFKQVYRLVFDYVHTILSNKLDTLATTQGR